MATIAGDGLQERSGSPSASGGAVAFVDRWIWVFMATLQIAAVLIGFVPDSIAKIGAVQAGARAPFPAVLHVHAALMGSWLVLLLIQTVLMATGNRRWHMQLGGLAAMVALAIVVSGFILVPTMYGMSWAALHAAQPGLAPDAVPARLGPATNIVLFQIRAGTLFALFVVLGLLARRKDSGTHKRLMVLATSVPMLAAIARMGWLPTTMPGNPLAPDLYSILLVLPLFAWDLFRLGRIHRAYLIWIGFSLPAMIVVQLLWNSAWWFSVVPRLMRVV